MPARSSRRRALAVVAAAGVLFTVLPAATGATSEASAPTPVVSEQEGAFAEFVRPTETAVVVSQPDGSRFRARLTDAEVGGVLEVDGYSVVKGDDAWWRYASRRGPDGLEAATARVGVDKRPAGIEPHVGRVAASGAAHADVRSQLLRQIQVASRQATLQAAQAGGPRVFRFPVVLFATWYDPEEGQTAPQFQAGNDVAHYQAILDGFGGNPTGTLTEFYFENSYGQLLVEVDVLARPDGSPYVSTRSSLPGDEGRCYYGGIDPPENPLDDLDPLDFVIGAGGGGALGMAIELFNTTSLPFDHQFAKYDNDGDGSIDFLGIIHSGAEMAVTGDPCNTWSHAIAVSSFTGLVGTLLQSFGLPVPDTGFKLGLPVLGQSVTYDRLFTMPEFETREGVLTIGVAAHEMAHALGEPDYYGTDGLSSGSGDWDLMSGGSYGGSPSGSNPTWFNPASRVFQGWVTPTIVSSDRVGYELGRRSSRPSSSYTAREPNPNLVLVPIRWVEVGETTPDGHTWTANDVYGLVRDGDKGYVIEGWYLEHAGRMPMRAEGIHEGMTRESYFDRWLYGSGLLTWHFDYWRRSNVLFGQNGGNNDPNRMQMDIEEWDFNDNTQEIALNMNRAEASDVAWEAATGITSGTHRPNPAVVVVDGDPQQSIAIPGGPVTPLSTYDFVFNVEDNPANRTMRVTITPVLGDCTLQLLAGPAGAEKPQTELIDAGFVAAPETAIVTNPTPGRWIARVGDFAACLSATGEVTFEGQGAFDATGTADTWGNETQEPTGWAFTNVRTGGADGLSHGLDSGATDVVTVDIVHLGEDDRDVSPGFARPAETEEHGRVPVTAGVANAFSVPVFANGGQGLDDVAVEVRRDSPEGPVLARGTVSVPAYGSRPFTFDFTPAAEGPFALVAVVDPDDAVAEAVEGNNVQVSTGWAGPSDPSVLIVDDDGPGDTERVYAGALAALGIPYAIAERHVSAEDMARYDAVVWVATLDRNHGQLDENDRGAIADHLGGGGRLWLASNRAIEALTSQDAQAFGRRWFGVESTGVGSYYEPVQLATAGILGERELTIDVMPGRPFVDKLALAPSAAGEAESLGLLQGSGTKADGETLLGAHLDGSLEGTAFQSAVTGFSLSQVGDPAHAIEMVGAIMDHFGVEREQYRVRSADPVVYHSQIRQSRSGVDLGVRAIVLGGSEGSPVTLGYRHHGLGRPVTVDMVRSGELGGYRATIPAAEVTPDGIDYFLKAGTRSTWDPPRAEDGSVMHSIAVFLPDVAAEPVTPGPAPTPGPTTGGQLGSGGRLPATGAATGLAAAVCMLASALVLLRLRRHTH